MQVWLKLFELNFFASYNAERKTYISDVYKNTFKSSRLNFSINALLWVMPVYRKVIGDQGGSRKSQRVEQFWEHKHWGVCNNQWDGFHGQRNNVSPTSSRQQYYIKWVVMNNWCLLPGHLTSFYNDILTYTSCNNDFIMWCLFVTHNDQIVYFFSKMLMVEYIGVCTYTNYHVSLISVIWGYNKTR